MFLAILCSPPPAPSEALRLWAVDEVLIGIVLTAALGLGISWLAAWVTRRCAANGLMDPPSLQTTTIAPSLTTLDAAKLVDSDALVSIFKAGLVFDICAGREEAKEGERVQEAIVKLFTRPIFVLSPLLRRYPRRDTVLLGRFGPVGIVVLFHAMLGLHHTGEAVIWQSAAAAILSSIVLHGATSAPGVRLHRRR